ncbi:MAG TPA: hypothetical protein VFT16_05235 [Candidatus Saccharimonadales bacterium]|nr:hypothetical protein [Candidatus Saccharimonadales bacterium]
MHNPNTGTGFEEFTPAEVYEALVQHSDHEVDAILEQEAADREAERPVNEKHLERQIAVSNDVGSLALNFLNREGATGEDLMSELSRQGMELRKANQADFPASHKWHDPARRQALAHRLTTLSRMAPEDLFGSAKPNASERSEENVQKLLAEILDTGKKINSIGLYGDQPGRGLSVLKAGETLRGASLENIHLAPINVWASKVGQQEANEFRSTGKTADILAEAIAFTPTIERTRTVTKPAVPKRLFRTAESEEATYSYAPTMVEGPQGQEPGVIVSYKYQPIWSGPEAEKAMVAKGGDFYQESSGVRQGNIHAYAVVLPSSLAEKFRTAVQANPEVARKLGDSIVQEYANDTYKERWNTEKAREQGGEKFGHHVYPTYNSLPDDVPVHIYDATMSPHDRQVGREDYSHTILAR